VHTHRFFLAAPFAGGELPLLEADLHHLKDVLRIGPGDEIEAVTPDGGVLTVRLAAVGPGAAVGEVISSAGSPARERLVVCQALSKGRKMDLVVQKATELGAAAIVPFISERSVVRLDPAKAAGRQERWRRVAREAAKQCARADVPHVDVPMDIRALEPRLASDSPIVLHEKASVPLRKVLSKRKHGSLTLVIGPEGGFSDAEVSLFEQWGASVASLGALTLRTETAAIAAMAIAAYELGWLGGTKK
jgi:16S rRNA (uracil1498-N3)-methyltransferase